MTNEEEWTLKRLMGEVVGSGPRSAEDMTRSQATTAFRQILRQDVDPTTLGAFLLANRWKTNTPEELAAFIDVMIDESVARVAPAASAVDCGANYDGKTKTALLGLGGGLIAAAAGTPIVVHSGERIPTKRGATYATVLRELDIPTDLTPEASAQLVDRTGFGYYSQQSFNPGIHALLDRREQMGVRTVINTIETLANPSNAPIHIGSFYHLAFGKKLIDAIAESERAGFTRAIFFQGVEGYDDVRPGYTKVAEWTDGTIESWEIESADFGFDFDTEDLSVENVTVDSATITREVLSGDRADHFADAIMLNAAVRLYAAEEVTSIAEGINIAESVCNSGDALDILGNLQQTALDLSTT